MAVVFGIWAHRVGSSDHQFNLVFTLWDHLHGQSAGVVGSMFTIDNTHGAGPVIGNIFDGDELNDHDFVFPGNRSIVCSIGREGKGSVGCDRAGGLDGFPYRFGFNRTDLDWRSILENDLALNRISLEFVGVATCYA